jgi:hypothetical protein
MPDLGRTLRLDPPTLLFWLRRFVAIEVYVARRRVVASFDGAQFIHLAGAGAAASEGLHVVADRGGQQDAPW